MKMQGRLTVLTLCLGVALAALCMSAERGAEPGTTAGKDPAGGEGLELVYTAQEKVFPNGFKTVRMVTTLKNTGKKSVLLPLAPGVSNWLTLPRGAIRYFGKDAQGKPLTRRKFKSLSTAPAKKKTGGPVSAIVLKPGRSMELTGGSFDLEIPAAGKYSIWVQMEIDGGREILPGVKTWSGRLRSNELEREFRRPTWKPAKPGETPAGKPGGTETF